MACFREAMQAPENKIVKITIKKFRNKLTSKWHKGKLQLSGHNSLSLNIQETSFCNKISMIYQQSIACDCN